MKIFRAIGLGLALIIIRFLMPEVFSALEKTLLMFFDFLITLFNFGSTTFENGLFDDSFIRATANLVPINR